MAQGFDAEKLALTGEPMPLAENVWTNYSFSASKDGKLAVQSGGGKGQLTWLDRQGKALGTLGGVGHMFQSPRISPEGTRMAAVRRDSGEHPDIWVVNLAQYSETRLTSVPANYSYPVWSPDGKRIVFSSEREGADNLYLRPADGAGTDEPLLKTAERKQPLDWSRDGKFLLFSVIAAKTGYDVWVLPMDSGPAGERKPLPYLQTNANESSAKFSPDGRFAAYESDESGTAEVYVRPFDPADPTASGSGAGKVKISATGGTVPFWRADGKELLYTGLDRKVWSVDVATTPAFHAGTPKPLFEVPRGATTTTPDAQRFLFDIPVGVQVSPRIILNWQAALKK
jgi:Tol biopolymer transport system component